MRAKPDEVPAAVARLVTRQRTLEDELRTLRTGQIGAVADQLAGAAKGGLVIARQDGLDGNELRELALSLRDRPGVNGVALVGRLPGDGRVALVVAVTKDSGLDARAAASEAAKAVGGGGGGSPELATAGGRDESGIDRAVELLGTLLSRQP